MIIVLIIENFIALNMEKYCMLTIENIKWKVFSLLGREESRENSCHWSLSTCIVTRTHHACLPIIDRIVRMIVHACDRTRSVRTKLWSKILPSTVIALTCSSADNKAADCEIKLNCVRARFDHLIQPKGAMSPREFHANEFIAWLHVFSFMRWLAQLAE